MQCFPLKYTNIRIRYTFIILLLNLMWRGSFAQNAHSVINSKLTLSFKGQSYILLSDFNSDLYAGLNYEKFKTRYAAWHFKRYRLAGYHKIKDSLSVIDSEGNHYRGSLKGIHEPAEFSGTIKPLHDSLIQIKIAFDSLSLNQISLQFHYRGAPSFYGGGEQFSHFRLNGHKIPFFVEEQGIGRGDQPLTFFADLAAGSGGNAFTTYLPVPVLFGSDGLFILIENKEPAEIDLRKKGLIQITVRSNEMKLLIGKFHSFQSAVRYYNRQYGQKIHLPESARGTVLGLQGGREIVLRRLHEIIKSGNPVSALWIQDWCGKRVTPFGEQLWWKWQTDTLMYPNLKQMCDSLQKENIAVWGYINPYFADEGPLYEEFRDKGYFVKNKLGKDYRQNMPGFPFYTVDLTHPEARNRLKEIIRKNMLGSGLRGWMADFGEWLPLDAMLYDKSSAYAFHNRFPEEWAKLNREAIQEAGLEKEVVFFCRSGYTESAKYAPLFWMGDQTVNFGRHDGIKSTLPALLSSSISGMPLNHSDIGGYTSNTFPIIRSIRKPDVLYKWAELNAFTPVFRTHEGLKAIKNHQVYSDAKSIFHFARMGRIHAALKPYFENLYEEYAQQGNPPIRPLNFAFCVDGKFLKHTDESFMLGDGIWIVPNLKKHKKRFVLHLPPGRWINPYSKEWEKGKTICKYTTGKPIVYFSESFYTNPAHRNIAQEIQKILEIVR